MNGLYLLAAALALAVFAYLLFVLFVPEHFS